MQKRKLNSLTATLLGIAGNAPAYTIAITSWTLILVTKEYSAAVLFWCGLLVLGVAYSYGRLNRMQVSGGAAFTWVSNLVHPKAGFLAGWCLLAASILFLVSAALPAAKLALAVLSVSESKGSVLIASSLLIACLAAFSAGGVALVGTTQAILTLLELTTLTVLCYLLLGILESRPGSTISLSNFALSGASSEMLSQGIVIAIFFYWGWDVLFNASESTDNSERSSTIAGFISMGLLIIFFVVFAGIGQLLLTEEVLKNADGNVLDALSRMIDSNSLNLAVRVVFFISTIGAIFACFIQFSQTMHAQAKHGYFSKFFAKITTTNGTPVFAIATQAGLAIFVLACAAYSSTVDEILSATIGASAVFVSFYYGFAAIACIVNELRQNSSLTIRLARCAIPLCALLALWIAGALVAFSFSQLATYVICILFGIGIFMSFISRT